MEDDELRHAIATALRRHGIRPTKRNIETVQMMYTLHVLTVLIYNGEEIADALRSFSEQFREQIEKN